MHLMCVVWCQLIMEGIALLGMKFERLDFWFAKTLLIMELQVQVPQHVSRDILF